MTAKGYGEIITMTPSTTVAGLVYHLKGNTTWANADRDSSVTAENLLGVAMGTHANTNGMLRYNNISKKVLESLF